MDIEVKLTVAVTAMGQSVAKEVIIPDASLDAEGTPLLDSDSLAKAAHSAFFLCGGVFKKKTIQPITVRLEPLLLLQTDFTIASLLKRALLGKGNPQYEQEAGITQLQDRSAGAKEA